MAAAIVQHTFSGHETFPFRYPWLKKGFDAVREDANVFSRDDAITTLGVGKNMVRSIRHWCLAAGVLEDSPAAGSTLQLSELGICSWPTTALIRTSKTLPRCGCCTGRSPRIVRATTWFWTFSYFNEPEFTREVLASALLKWTQTLSGKQVAESSVRRDVEVFIRTYVPSRQPRRIGRGLA